MLSILNYFSRIKTAGDNCEPSPKRVCTVDDAGSPSPKRVRTSADGPDHLSENAGQNTARGRKGGKEKREWQLPGIECRTPGLCNKTATELRQLDNDQPSQSSICTAQVVLNSLVPRPSPAPAFDRLQYAKTEGEGLVNLTT